jgi:oligoribonuclease (3'-5' exoribonuclease)
MICFLDTETTGLDHKVDSLLEVAAIITDDDLNVKCSMNTVVRPVGGLDLTKIHPRVIEMHTKNGLFHDVGAFGIRRYEAELALIKFMQDLAKRMDLSLEELKMPLAGNTIGFDRRFLEEHMPKFHALFHYRSIDVTGFNEAAKRFNPELHELRPRSDENHRAYGDALSSLQQLAFYRKLFEMAPSATCKSLYTLVIVESPYAPKIPRPMTSDEYAHCPCVQKDEEDWKCERCKSYEAWCEELGDNEDYARAAMKDSLMKGEAPYASHLLYTQRGVLDDTIPEQRNWGIQAGFAWRQVAAKTVVYTDRGISKGMQYGIDDAKKRGTPIEYRELGPNWKDLLK